MGLASILWTATLLLAVTAVGGLIMAVIGFKGTREPPVWLAMLHGFLAAAALTLLLYAAATVGLPQAASAALVLLVLAAGGGVLLNLKYHWNRVPLPRWLIVGHAATAVVGFVLLVIATWASRSG